MGDHRLQAAWIASLFGWTAGSLVYLEFGFATGFFNPPTDALLIYLFLSAIFAVVFMFGGLAAGLLANLRPGSGADGQRRAGVFFGAFATIALQASLLTVEFLRPFAFDAGGLGLLSLVVLGSAGIARALAGWSPGLALFAAVQLAILATGVGFAWSGLQAPAKQSMSDVATRANNSKVIVIGIDGATWRIMDRLIEQGRLPNIAKLAAGGARGDLLSIASPLNPLANTSGRGMRTPVIWTTISTGKTETEHGILDFVFTKVPGLEKPIPMRVPLLSQIGKWENLFSVPSQPVNASTKRVVEIWDIVGSLGRRAGILNWVVSHPITRTTGVRISDLFRHPIERRAYPTGLLPEDFAPDALPEERLHELWRFVDRTGDPDASIEALLEDPVLGEALSEFAEQYFQDSFIMQFGSELYAREDFDLFAIYVDATDVAGHLFFKFMEPEHFAEVDPRQLALLHQLVDEIFVYVDEAIGNLVAQRDEGTLVILCSDHGMGPWKEASGPLGWLGSRSANPFNSGNHRREGIVLLNGAGVEPGSTIDDATVLDIAPTVLHYLGYPVADDMSGKPLTSVMTDAWVGANPVAAIDTYEGRLDGPDQDASEIPSEVDEQLKDRLRALGYIE